MIKKAILCIFTFSAASIGINIFAVYSSPSFDPKALQPPVSHAHLHPLENVPEGPYTYLGHGKQSVAFKSADKRYVLKLFYWKRPLKGKWIANPENWLRLSSPSWILKLAKKRGEVRLLFNRYLWGLEELPKETSLVGVHFCHTEQPIPVNIIDRDGRTHALDLSNYPFVLQKKVTLLGKYLDKKLDQGDELGAKKAVRHLRKYFAKRIGMGYLDNPEVFVKNYGIRKKRPVQIDVGKLNKYQSCDVEMEKEKVFNNLNRFLKKHYPSLLESD